MVKYVFFVITYFIFCSFAIFSQDFKNLLPSDSVITINISFVGDLMCHSTQFEYAQIKKDSFNFKPTFEKVKTIIERADFAIGNLETTMAGTEKRFSGYPAFNTPDDYLEALKYAGFDLLLTANNHALDTKKVGALRTAAQIEEYGMSYNGTNLSKYDQDSIRIYNVKGIDFALLSYTYNTNVRVNHKGGYPIINYIDTLEIKRAITNAASLTPDLIIVYFHFGDEYSREPSAYQKEIVNKTIKYGADIIVASHPHVIQPIELFQSNSGRIDTGFVAYSLGNFVSNQRWRYSDCGVILNFSINKKVSQDVITLGDITFTPTWVFKGNTGNKNEYVILPTYGSNADSSYSFISKNDLMKMKESHVDTKEILTKMTDRPRLKINQNSIYIVPDSKSIKAN